MVDIIRRQEPSRGAMAQPEMFEPFRIMRELLRMDPFRDLGLMRPSTGELSEFNPSFDVKETKDCYCIMADVPGVEEKDIEISVHGNRLQIQGKRESEKEEKGETYYTSERSYGSFTRIFTLPEDANADQIDAKLKDGVLEVSVQKSGETATKKVPIKAS